MPTITHLSSRQSKTTFVGLVGSLCLMLCLTPVKAQRPNGDTQDEDHGRPVALIAHDLGVTPEQFRAAFKKVHPSGRGQEPTQAQRQANRKILSETLGVSPEKLDEVMDKYRPGGRGTNGPPRPQGAFNTQNDQLPPTSNGPQDEDHGRPVALVARDLGVTPEQFRAAFKKVHPAGAGKEPTEAQRRANRKVLAETLGVSPEKLDEVMDKYRPGGRGTNGQHRGEPIPE